MLRHNKYGDVESLVLILLLFPLVALGFYEDGWKKRWDCFFIATKVFLHHPRSRGTLLRHAENGSSVPTLNVQPCHVTMIYFFFEKEHRFPLYFSVRAFPAPLRAESRGAPGKRSTTTEQSHFQENSVSYASIEIGPKENSAKKARHVGKLMKGSLAKKKSWFSLRTTLSSASFFQSH